MSIRVERENTINSKRYMKVITEKDIVSRMSIYNITNKKAESKLVNKKVYSYIVTAEKEIKKVIRMELADNNNIRYKINNTMVIILKRYNISDNLYNANDIRIEISNITKKISRKI